jgi:hypothetical protein
MIDDDRDDDEGESMIMIDDDNDGNDDNTIGDNKYGNCNSYHGSMMMMIMMLPISCPDSIHRLK